MAQDEELRTGLIEDVSGAREQQKRTRTALGVSAAPQQSFTQRSLAIESKETANKAFRDADMELGNDG